MNVVRSCKKVASRTCLHYGFFGGTHDFHERFWSRICDLMEVSWCIQVSEISWLYWTQNRLIPGPCWKSGLHFLYWRELGIFPKNEHISSFAIPKSPNYVRTQIFLVLLWAWMRGFMQYLRRRNICIWTAIVSHKWMHLRFFCFYQWKTI